MCIAFSGIFYRYADVEPSTASVFRCLGIVLVVGGIAAATVPIGWLRDRARARLAAERSPRDREGTGL